MTTHTRGTLPFRAATVFVTLAAASLWIAYPHGAQAVAVDRGSRDYTLPEQMQSSISTVIPPSRASTPTS